MKRFDVCVQGEGPVGRALALALARQGLSVASVARASGLRDPGQHGNQQGTPSGARGSAAPDAAGPSSDIRTYALNAGSVSLLQTLKVWDAIPQDARTAVLDMRIEGDAPGAALGFSAYEQAVEALAWIVDAGELDAALGAAVRFAPHIQRLDSAEAAGMEAALQVFADGRDSPARARLGIANDSAWYGHSAVATRLIGAQAHAGVARQWFGHPDVLALLPFDRPHPGQSWGLVWSVPAQRAEALRAMPPAEFEQALLQATGGAVGALTVSGERAVWPLRLARAREVCGPGWVLVGDAAHVVHPLAGQGLNLGLADVASLAAVLAEREPWRHLGDEKLLRRHARRRHGPTLAMAGVTDGLWQLFARPDPIVREVRNRGMMLLDRLGPLKKALVARALHS
jgi:2-polyprenyl-6-methoxyphenol hydroxylase-like FAD-dependent oxidoreductase